MSEFIRGIQLATYLTISAVIIMLAINWHQYDPLICISSTELTATGQQSTSGIECTHRNQLEETRP